MPSLHWSLYSGLVLRLLLIVSFRFFGLSLFLTAAAVPAIGLGQVR